MALNLTSKPCSLSLLLFLLSFCEALRHDSTSDHRSIELGVNFPKGVLLGDGSGGSRCQRCEQPVPMCHLHACSHTSERDSATFNHQNP
jgi:hypothetical protein